MKPRWLDLTARERDSVLDLLRAYATHDSSVDAAVHRLMSAPAGEPRQRLLAALEWLEAAP